MVLLGQIIGFILLCIYYIAIGFLSILGLLIVLMLLLEFIDIVIFRREDRE